MTAASSRLGGESAGPSLANDNYTSPCPTDDRRTRSRRTMKSDLVNRLLSEFAVGPRESGGLFDGVDMRPVPPKKKPKAQAPIPVRKAFRDLTRGGVEAEESQVWDEAKQRLVAAGRKPEVADAEAAEYARRVRVAAEREESRGAGVRKGAAGEKASFNQPIDAAVNPDEKVPVLDISGVTKSAQGAQSADILSRLKGLLGKSPFISRDAAGIITVPSRRNYAMWSSQAEKTIRRKVGKNVPQRFFPSQI